MFATDMWLGPGDMRLRKRMRFILWLALGTKGSELRNVNKYMARMFLKATFNGAVWFGVACLVGVDVATAGLVGIAVAAGVTIGMPRYKKEMK
jgi:hypothetical protein